MQYRTSFTAERNGAQEKGIIPKILIEPLMRDEVNIPCEAIHVYCFSGRPKLLVKIKDKEIVLFDEKLDIIDDTLSEGDIKTNNIIEEKILLIKEILSLSKSLSKQFLFVRIDWMIFENKIYFEEITYTPFSGFSPLKKHWNIQLGKMINLGE